MAKEIVCSIGLMAALEAEGFKLPEDCREVRLVMPAPDEAMTIQYECFVSPERLSQIGRALQRLAQK